MAEAYALKWARRSAKEIVRQGAMLVRPLPLSYRGRSGAKKKAGYRLAFLRLKPRLEHVEKYKLPLEYMDMVMYTGSGYSGRNLQLTRISDAVIVGCGRIGTLNEFTIAFEDNKPIGVLERRLVTRRIDKKNSGRIPSTDNGKVVYDKDPKKLVEKVIDLVKREKSRQSNVPAVYQGIGMMVET